MAKYRSIFKIEGTIGDVTFYKGKNGYYVRNKTSVNKNRILTDPKFARTRENLSEFGHTATMGKYIRQAISGLLADAKDSHTSSRLTQVLSKVKNEDLSSARGQRKVITGLATAAGKAWLKGFNFNANANLDSVLMAEYTLNPSTGELVIADLVPSQQLDIPDGATHVGFSTAFLNLDLETNTKDLQVSPVSNLPINTTPTTVTLTPPAPATGSGLDFYFLKVAFFQEINATQYPLNNGAFNALQLIEVV